MTVPAAPYTKTATISLGSSNPERGARLYMEGQNFAPRETVVIKIDVKSHKKFEKRMRLQNIGVAKTDKDGDFSTSVRLPKKATCSHFIVAKGVRSKKIASAKINIRGCNE